MKRLLFVLLLVPSIVMGQGYYLQTAYSAQAQNKLWFDLFNASGSGKTIYINAIAMQKNFTAVTGTAWQLDLVRTTSVGTGGASLSIYKFDSQAPNLPAGITARAGATGGASLGNSVRLLFLHSEETNQAAQLQEAMPIWPPLIPFFRVNIILREGEGITLKQITNTTIQTYSVWVAFTTI
jgi:hypothetical protein